MPSYLRTGSYYIEWNNEKEHLQFEGTLRLEIEKYNIRGSGDIYLQHLDHNPFKKDQNKIPHFDYDRYASYLKVIQDTYELDDDNIIKLRLSKVNYNKELNKWEDPEDITIKVKLMKYPDPYLKGEILRLNSQTIGDVKLRWISKFFRSATIKMDAASGVKFPDSVVLDNGDKITWNSIFNKVGWDLTIIEGKSDLVPTIPNKKNMWAPKHLHERMLKEQERDVNGLPLDKKIWQYHLLCVNILNKKEWNRGVMYDSEITNADTNLIPREGAAICSDWIFDKEFDEWGICNNKKFGEEPIPYFRTAVHEIGHAMGLGHNAGTLTLMNPTDLFKSNSFPKNINWDFTPENENYLKHAPDISVRPCKSPSVKNVVDIADSIFKNENRLSFKTKGSVILYPYGAPIRIDLSVINTTELEVIIPASLSLKEQFITGYTEDSSGCKRYFKSIISCADSYPLKELKPKRKEAYSFSLFSGESGWLFPTFGPYKVTLEMRWFANNLERFCSDSCTVLINSPADEKHAETALKIIESPELVLGILTGDNDKNDYLFKEIQKSKILKDHYAYFLFKRKLDSKSARSRYSAWNQLNSDSVLSHREKVKVKKAYKEAMIDIKKKKSKASPTLIKNIDSFSKRCPNLVS